MTTLASQTLINKYQEPVTPRQVQSLETFIERERGRSFVLIFEVGQVEEVRREGNRGL